MTLNNLIGHLLGLAVGASVALNPTTMPIRVPDFMVGIDGAERNGVEMASTTVEVVNPRIKAILSDLRPCESGNRDGAINPEDLDGTASYGRYQFKPGTLYAWNAEYKVLPNVEEHEIMNVIMDGEFQERVLTKAIEEHGRDESWWMQHFPGCSRIYRFWEYPD